MASPAALDIKELYTVKITDLPCQADFPFEQAFVGPCLQAYASFLPHRSFYCYRDDLRDDTDERTTWGVLCFSSRKDAISHAGFLIANPIQLSDDPVRSVLFYATQRSVSVLERVHADPDVAAKALEEVLRQDADKERWEGAGRGNPPALGQSGPKLTPQKRGAEEGLQRPPSGGQRPDPAWRAEPGPSAAPADRQQQGAVPVREPPLQKGAQWLGRTVPQAPPPTQPPANAALDAFTRAREGSRRMIAETLRTSEFLDAEDEAQVQAETTALAASIEGELLRLLGRNEVEYIKKASWLARNLRRNKDLLWMVVSQQLKPPELVRMSEKQLEACRREEPADENEGANRRTEEEIAGQFASNGGPSGHLWEPMDEMEPPPPPPPPPPRQSNSAVTAEMDDRVAAALINEEDAAVSKLRGGVDIAEDMELESPPPKLSPPNVPPERVGEWEPMDAGVAWETRKSEAFKGAVDPRQEVLLKGSGVFWTGPLQWGTQSVEVTAAGLRPLKRSPSTFVLPPEIKIGKSMTLQNVDRVLEEVSTPSKDLPRFWLLGQGLPQASANAANVVGRVLINAKGELLPHYSAGWDRKVPYGWELFIMPPTQEICVAMGVSDYEGAAARNASALMAVLLPLYWGHLYPGGRAEPQKACGVTAAGALTLHHLPPVLEFQHFAKHEKFPEVEAHAKWMFMEPQLRVFPHSAPQDTKRFNSALTAVLDPRNRRTYVRPLSVPPTNEPIELLLYAPTTRQSLPSALWGAHRQFMLLGCWSGTHETRVPHNVRLGLTARYR